MSDVHDLETRSFNMSQIRGKNTTPELLVRRFLFSKGFRFRLHCKDLPGKPDIVLPRFKTIVDIRGCFWHVHENCRFGSEVNTESRTITDRRESAVRRDERNIREWKELGWRVIVIWAECQLEPRKKHSRIRETTLTQLVSLLKDEDTGY